MGNSKAFLLLKKFLFPFSLSLLDLKEMRNFQFLKSTFGDKITHKLPRLSRAALCQLRVLFIDTIVDGFYAVNFYLSFKVQTNRLGDLLGASTHRNSRTLFLMNRSGTSTTLLFSSSSSITLNLIFNIMYQLYNQRKILGVSQNM